MPPDIENRASAIARAAIQAATVFVLAGVGVGSAGAQTFNVLHGFDSPPANPYAEVLEGSDGALYGTAADGGLYDTGIIFKINRDGTSFQKLHDFHVGDAADGGYPYSALVEGSDGALYGTTSAGGETSYGNGEGIVFRINKDGTGFAKLHDFLGGDPENGAYPYAGLVEASDGALYGTTPQGGTYGAGIVFRINKDGTGFFKLHDFNDSDPANGSHPYSGLREGSDGALYGNAGGGSYYAGVVYKLNRDGTGFLKLHDFNYADTANGAAPRGALHEGSDGAFYGVTFIGGSYDYGTVFKISKDGTGFLKLLDFDFQTGVHPEAGLIGGSGGALYGMTTHGGAHYRGTAFRINEDGSGFLKLHEFGGADGDYATAGLVEGSDGILYGTTAEGGAYNLGVAFKVSKDGSGFARLHDFSPSVGAFSQAKVLAGSDGALYGTTYGGGAHGSGTVFKLTSASVGFPFHKFQVLHDFDFDDPANGSYPRAGLVEGSDGALYGTTSWGGAFNAGIVFRINKDGTGFLRVHDFKLSGGEDSGNPWSGVIEGSDGALYGTTVVGGAFFNGVVFKMNKDGTGFRTLHDFERGVETNGTSPQTALIEGSDGVLYGTTPYGGLHDDGIAFGLNRDGSGFLKLHDFKNGDPADGAYPYAELLEASNGALYGTTSSGGAYNMGVAFRVNKDGSGFLKLLDFDSPSGWNPKAGFTEGADGTLYGTTSNGGARLAGTVFRVNKDGTGFLALHSFDYSDGAWPYAGLVQGPKGLLFGTTSRRGPAGGGVVFALGTEALPPARGSSATERIQEVELPRLHIVRHVESAVDADGRRAVDACAGQLEAPLHAPVVTAQRVDVAVARSDVERPIAPDRGRGSVDRRSNRRSPYLDARRTQGVHGRGRADVNRAVRTNRG